MKLRTLFENTGTQVGAYLVQYLNDQGIKVSEFIPEGGRGVLRIIEGDKKWVNISVFNDGQIIAVATPQQDPDALGMPAAPEWLLKTVAAQKKAHEELLVTNYHNPDSFEKVEAFIRKHLET